MARQNRLVTGVIRLSTGVPVEPLVGASNSVPVGYVSSPGPVDFNHLSNVTSGIKIDYQDTSFHDQDNILFAGVTLKNVAGYSLTGTLVIAVKNMTDHSVGAAHPDGLTPDGLPYYDLSHLLFTDPTVAFDPGEVLAGFDLTFRNPNEIQFDYELVVYSHINQAPDYLAVPESQVALGNTWTIDTEAVDPDGDAVTYSVVAGPVGVTVDASTGTVTWTPAAGDIGLHQLLLRATDPFGLSDDQVLTVSVYQGLPNRTPYFTSSPIVDAFPHHGNRTFRWLGMRCQCRRDWFRPSRRGGVCRGCSF